MFKTITLVVLSLFYGQAYATYSFNEIQMNRYENQTEYYTNHLSIPSTQTTINTTQQPLSKSHRVRTTKEKATEELQLAILDLKNDIKLIRENIHTAPKVASNAPVYFSQSTEVLNQPPSFWFLCGISSLLIMAALRSLMPSRKLKKIATTNANYDLEENEYDFLGSEEGLPSKLDLARAYIEMNEFKEAEKTLNEIIASRNTEYTSKAKTLLKSIH